MKPDLLLLLATILVAAHPVHSETSTKTSSNYYRGTTASRPTFKTSEEAIEHYKTALSDSKGTSVTAFYISLQIYDDTEKLKETLTESNAKVAPILEKAGNLKKVDVCEAPKLGNSIQRVGFILVYEHNIGFADAWLINTSRGWLLANISFTFNSEPVKTLISIPSEYFNK